MPSEARRGRLRSGLPRAFGCHTGPLARAYRASYAALTERYGTPARGSGFEAAMLRTAVAEARLGGARELWAALLCRLRHTDRSRAELRAAVKDMERADQALSRALDDLRSAVPPPRPLTKAEQEHAAYLAKVAKFTAEKEERDRVKSPRPAALPGQGGSGAPTDSLPGGEST
jgi:hypothetical protein